MGRISGTPDEADQDCWDRAARRNLEAPYLDRLMAETKRTEHLALLDRWLPDLSGKVLLKTDLWEEAVTGDELLFSLARRSAGAIGMDLSQVVVEAAEARAPAQADLRFLRADVRRIPLEEGSVDAVVSNSTLDHLPDQAQQRSALVELRRVLVGEGLLVVTIDNAQNLGDPLLQAAGRVGALPFPLGRSLSLEELRELVVEAGFEPRAHALIVPAPRVVATALMRAARFVPGQSERAPLALLAAFERLMQRAPRRFAAFVALLATAPPKP